MLESKERGIDKGLALSLACLSLALESLGLGLAEFPWPQPMRAVPLALLEWWTLLARDTSTAWDLAAS